MDDNKLVDITSDQFLATADAARLIGLAQQTLASDRVSRRLGIPFHRFGAAVRYRRGDILAWAASHRQMAANG